MNSAFRRRTGTPSGGHSTSLTRGTVAMPTIVVFPPLSDGRHQEAARPGKQRGGNNHFGNVGTLKCQPCRKIKCKCHYNKTNPEEICGRCKKRGFICGPKVSAKQGRELERGGTLSEQPAGQREIWSPDEPYLDKILAHLDPSESPEVMKRKILKELEDDENRQRPADYLMEDVDTTAIDETEYEYEDDVDEKSVFEDDPAELNYTMPFDVGARFAEQPLYPWIDPAIEQASAINHAQYNAGPFRPTSAFHQAAPEPLAQPFHHPQSFSEHCLSSPEAPYQTARGSQGTYSSFGQLENAEMQQRTPHFGDRNDPPRPFNNLHLPQTPRYPNPGQQQYGNLTAPEQSQHRHNSFSNHNPNQSTGHYGQFPRSSRRQ